MPDKRYNRLISDLENFPGVIADILCQISPEELEWSPDESVWSPHQMIGHIVDVEIAYGFRIRMVISELNPTYPGFDEEKWTSALKHSQIPLDLFLTALKGLRALNIALLSGLEQKDRMRTGIHAQSGSQTLNYLIHSLAKHDQYHLKRLEELNILWRGQSDESSI